MKILFLYDFPLWGNGSGEYLRNLTEELVKKKHDVGIVAPEERRFLESKIKQYSVRAPQIPVFVGHPELQGAKRYSELSTREITDIYKAYLNATLEAVFNFNPDVIHANHLSIISWVARYIYALTDIKYVITTHGSCLNNLLENKRYISLCQDAVRHAKAITTVSKNTKDRFLETFDEDMITRSRIIPGGVNLKNFPKNIDVSHIEKEYNIKGKKVVFFSGRLSSEKGVRYLVNAADKIKGEVFVAGEGPKMKELEKIKNKKNLSNVHLLGYLSIEELIPFYYRADVFVAPSVVAEAFGLVILEAMAARTPVITTKRGALPLLIKEGYNGLFVKARNSKDIAQKCNIILEDDELREKLSKNARKDVEEKFAWKGVADRFELLYKMVTGDYRKELEEQEKELKTMKKAELIKKAMEREIDFAVSRITKKELIKKLKNNGD